MSNKTCNECARIRWACTTFREYADNNFNLSAMDTSNLNVVNDCCDFMHTSTKGLDCSDGYLHNMDRFGGRVSMPYDYFYSYGEKITTAEYPTKPYKKPYIPKSLSYTIIEEIAYMKTNKGIDPNTLLISKNKLDLLEKSIIDSLKDYKGIKVDISKSEFLGLKIIIVEQSNYMKVAIV